MALNFGASTVWHRSHAAPTCPRWTSAWQLLQAVDGGVARPGAGSGPELGIRGSAGRTWQFAQVSAWCKPAKNSGVARVRERFRLERRREVARLAEPAELAFVLVLVARAAVSAGAAEVQHLERQRHVGRRERRVALAALEPVVAARQGESRACGVVERRLPEARFAVALAAILAGAFAVRIRVARATPVVRERGADSEGVAFRAGHVRVGAGQRVAGLRVIEAARRRRPPLRDVAGGTGPAHRAAVGSLVARRAVVELEAAEDAVGVALLARHVSVRARELEPCGGVIELRPRLLERDGGAVAFRAVAAELALVGVGVARVARRAGSEEAARLVAGGAVGGLLRVQAVEGETGFRRVIECLPIQAAQVRVSALVLDVAAAAVAGDGAVYPLLRRDPVGNRPMTGQTPLGRDFPAHLVALLAGGDAFESLVRAGERSWRHLQLG